MIKNSVTTFHAARCLQSHIIYRCDLQRATSANIHLGVLIELVGGNWHSLGVALRRALDKSEIDAIASTWRERLSAPFNYFQAEFETAWNEAEPGACIDWLASKYGASLLVEPALQVDHQRIVPADGDMDLEQVVRAHVFSMLDVEAKQFLDLSKPPAVVVESERAKVA